jgi:tRNA G18 (ribose-2'-O)-methylase SpoU
MLKTIPVDDADDPRLADYTRLTDVSLRISLEAAHGLFIAEGTKVISRAVRAGYPVRSMLLAQSRAADLDDLAVLPGQAVLPGEAVLPGHDVPAYVVPDEVAERLTGYRVHRGALASMRRVELPAVGKVLAVARRIVVLEDLVDHGNVGAIFRCAAALGIDAVILSPRCADPLYRRSVKVSMGAVFAIPYGRMADWRDGLAELRAAGFTLLALTPDERATPIAEAFGNLSGPRNETARAGLLLGTEGDGLSSRWLHEADEAVRIPMSPGARAAGVDSLNVVAAAAIACNLLAQLPKSYDREGELRRLITEDCDAGAVRDGRRP